MPTRVPAVPLIGSATRSFRALSSTIAVRRGAMAVLCVAVSVPVRASAADVADRQGLPVFVRSSGPYLGLEGGGGSLFPRYGLVPGRTGNNASSTTDAGDDPGSTGGILLGYGMAFDRLIAGIEGDAAGVSLRQALLTDGSPPSAASPARISTGFVGTLRGRLGVAVGPALIFVTGGGAYTNVRVGPGGRDIGLVGYTVGAGVETPLGDHFMIGAEYRRTQYDTRRLPAAGTAPASSLTGSSGEVLARITWYPDGVVMPRPLKDGLDAHALDNWSLHGQSTFIQQGVPGFRSPYAGANSLLPSQARQTWTNTAYIGLRLREGTEVYVDPEFTQGFGPSGTLGLAGFSNGEAAKAGFTYPRFQPQRYFVRQIIGFGGEKEDVEDATNQVAGKRDVDRLTLTFGKLSVTDVFDDNMYAHDPRINFMNGAIFTSAAYDYPANLAGYTNGFVADLNRKDWALRAAAFQVPKFAGTDDLDGNLRRGGVVVEYERRFDMQSRPGKLRLGAFLNRTFSGSYGQALLSGDVNEGIYLSRQTRDKRGIYVGLEQGLTDDLGLFGRLSWNDGRNEIVSYTDVDASLAAGLSLKGKAWDRPDDVVGLGGAINALAPAHRTFLARGGLGLLIGDGRLDYASERILESYYAYKVTPAATVTLDCQLIANPAYNADRGPVAVISGRFHIDY